MTSLKTVPQMKFSEQHINNDALLEMLQTWEDTKEGTAAYKKALRDIKVNAPHEPGRYRVNQCLLIVSQKKTVKIETID